MTNTIVMRGAGTETARALERPGGCHIPRFGGEPERRGNGKAARAARRRGKPPPLFINTRLEAGNRKDQIKA